MLEVTGGSSRMVQQKIVCGFAVWELDCVDAPSTRGQEAKKAKLVTLKEQLVFSSKCGQLSQRKHMLALTLSGWSLLCDTGKLASGRELANYQIEEEGSLTLKHKPRDVSDLERHPVPFPWSFFFTLDLLSIPQSIYYQ